MIFKNYFEIWRKVCFGVCYSFALVCLMLWFRICLILWFVIYLILLFEICIILWFGICLILWFRICLILLFGICLILFFGICLTLLFGICLMPWLAKESYKQRDLLQNCTSAIPGFILLQQGELPFQVSFHICVNLTCVFTMV